MKKYLLTISVLLLFQLTYAQSPLNIMTFNLRLNTPADSANSWPFRKDLVARQILSHQTDIVGVQEALNDQMEDLKERLKNYASIGVGREDGKTKGEYSAIFYNTDRLQMLNHATFWLSETPDKAGSRGWDAALPRIVTWGLFKDLKSGKEFYAFNTHFDHMGKTARKESALLLMKKVNEIAGNKPVVITGDFNAIPADEPIRLLLDPENPLHFIDSKAISKTAHSGPEGTFNNFVFNNSKQERIDYIFIKNGMSVLNHATLVESSNNRYTSDHFPVFAQIVLPTTY